MQEVVTKTFKKVINKQVVVEEGVVERTYSLPLYLVDENSNSKTYVKITQDFEWDGSSEKYDVVLIDVDYGRVESVTFDVCFCYNFLEYVEDFTKCCHKEDYDRVVSATKELME